MAMSQQNKKPTHIELKDQVIKTLQTIYDPEIPVNIYELGLIYDVDVSLQNEVHIRMTLTTPYCPAAQHLPLEVEAKLKAIEGVKSVQVEIVWDPPWSMDMMSEAAKLELGLL